MLRAACVLGATVFVMLLTLGVCLVRAGDPVASNWPISFDVENSDNSVLFQFAQQLFSGAPMDWSFSPQVYAFPEIPISLLAYLFAGGDIYWYFFDVAAINMGLLFLALHTLVAQLRPGDPFAKRLARSSFATAPLILLPLVALQNIYLFQFAPTYYYGMYPFAFLLPVAFLTKNRVTRVAVLSGWALTGAANPLLFAMTLPCLAAAGCALWRQSGFRIAVSRIALPLSLPLTVALVIRITLFDRLAATSPLSYISWSMFLDSWAGIVRTFDTGFDQGADRYLLALSLIAMAACLTILIRSLLRMRPHRGNTSETAHAEDTTGSQDTTSSQDTTASRTLAVVYLTTLPFLGVIAMLAIIALYIYYFWFAIVGSIVIVILLLPPLRALVPVSMSVAGISTAGIAAAMALVLPAGIPYFGYREAITQCLDATLPASSVGYSTFSDARRFSLTSTESIQMIAITPQMHPTDWLANRALARAGVGTFVLINPNDNGESPLTVDEVEATFGEPDSVVECGDTGASLMIYSSAEARARVGDVVEGWE